MKVFVKTVTSSLVSLFLAGGVALAQYPHHDDQHDQYHHDDSHHDDYGHDDHHGDDHDRYVRHNDWHHGGHISHDDWNRGRAVDYHRYHLSAPPRGYAWRQVDGNYVLASIATGLIASAIVASTAGR